MITKFSRMGSLPHFLTHGAPQVCFVRHSSALNAICFVSVLSWITGKYDDIRSFGICFELPFLSVFINDIRQLFQSSGELLITC